MTKKVFIDPGHGGSDSGAVGINNLLEKNINLSVAKKLETLLKSQGIEVKLSRSSDTALSLSERTTSANKWGANCFVSIHCNAFDGKASGVETFSYSKSTNNLASSIQSEILKTSAYTLNRGLKTANFYVLKHSSMRSTLIEMGFIDNSNDAKILVEKQDSLALAIAKGICNYLGIKYIPNNTDNDNVTTPAVVSTDTFYRVVCGSFNNRIYAEEKIAELKSKGFDDVFIDIYHKN